MSDAAVFPASAKAVSVTVEGQPDDWRSPRGFRVQVAPDGNTRIVAYVPPDELRSVHERLIDALGGAVSVRYLRLTDRTKGQLPKPETYVRMDAPAAEVRAALADADALVWRDGRHQLWLRGRFGEQVVLDELGVLYCYPDDPAFREALGALPETTAVGMDGRDYVRVQFLPEADAQEATLIARLSMQKWG
jgi:hypothetical protein